MTDDSPYPMGINFSLRMVGDFKALEWVEVEPPADSDPADHWMLRAAMTPFGSPGGGEVFTAGVVLGSDIKAFMRADADEAPIVIHDKHVYVSCTWLQGADVPPAIAALAAKVERIVRLALAPGALH